MAAERLVVRVKPGSSKGPLIIDEGDAGIVVYVREKAIDGQANDGVTAVLAKHLGVAASRVRVVRGHTARIKQIEVDR
jgi:uncharacterized protein YggU (UPF0235/DUF167 family)